MSWDCTVTNDRLSEALEGLLSREDAAAYSAHLAGCAQCRELAREIGAMVDRIHSLEMVPAPPELVKNILDSTLTPRVKEAGWRKWFTWKAGVFQPRYVMGAITVAASLLIVIHASGISTGKIRRLDLNPVNLFRAANRQAHLSYARGLKFVNDLRVVYEIQSRLEPAPEPSTVTPPSSEPKSEPSAPNPQEKSEKKPPHDRTQLRSRTMFAVSLPSDRPHWAAEVILRNPQ